MKKSHPRKVLGLIAIITCGVCSAIAQSGNGLSITGGSGGSDSLYCISANASSTPFTVSYSGTDGFYLDPSSCVWTNLGGGITISGGVNSPTAYISSLSGTTYSENYSKYAKGKLKVDCTLRKDTVYTFYCDGEFVSTDSVSHTRQVYMEIEIRKAFVYANELTRNEIVGPECIELGETVTYSIAPWVSQKDANRIGFDDYNWINAPNEVYYSSDKSSITFTIDSTFLSHKTLAVSMGACNSTQDTISRSLGEKPADPIIDNDTTLWANGYCLPFGAGERTLTITNPQPGVTYSWEKLGGWTYTQTNTTLTFTADNDAREIRLKAESPCETKTYDLMINRSFAENSTISNNSETPSCLTTGDDFVFEVQGAGGGILMSWEIEEGSDWEILDINTIAKPRIKAGSSPCLISVTDECGNKIEQEFFVRPEKPGDIEGDFCLVQDSTTARTYSIDPVDNADSYKWTYPQGWSIQGDSTNTEITLIPDGQTIGQIKVQAIGCDTSIWSNPLSVNYNLAKPDAYLVNTCIDAGLESTITVRVNNPIRTSGVTYHWEVLKEDSLGTITNYSNANDPSERKINTKGYEGDFLVTVYAQNSLCGMSEKDTIIVHIEKEAFTVEEYPSARNSIYGIYETWEDDWYYSHNAVWTYNNNDVTGSDYSTTISLPKNLMSLADSTFYVTVEHTTTGCKTRKYADNGMLRSTTVQEVGTTSLRSAVIEGEMKISPNPTKGEVEVSISIDEIANIFLYNLDGSLLKQWMRQPATSTISISDLPSGKYLIVALQKGKRYSKQIILNK
jgi:hypothetical protein